METDHAYSAEFFLVLGLSMVMSAGLRRNSVVVENIRFMTHFGTPPSIVVKIWAMLTDTPVDPFFKPKHLLWTLLFLKTCPTFDVLANRVSADEKTVRKWVWYGIHATANLIDQVVRVVLCFVLLFFVVHILMSVFLIVPSKVKWEN